MNPIRFLTNLFRFNDSPRKIYAYKLLERDKKTGTLSGPVVGQVYSPEGWNVPAPEGNQFLFVFPLLWKARLFMHWMDCYSDSYEIWLCEVDTLFNVGRTLEGNKIVGRRQFTGTRFCNKLRLIRRAV